MSAIKALKQNVEFHKVYSRGKSVASSRLVSYALKSKNDGCRVGITTSKKIGTAVERNRCRRVIRAAYRSISDEIDGNWDIVFVARFKTKTSKTPVIEQTMRDQLIQLGVIKQG